MQRVVAFKSTKYDYELRSPRGAVAALKQLGSGNPALLRFRLGLEFAVSGRRDFEGMIVHHAAMARSLGDHDEMFTEGDAFSVPRGHTPEVAAGTEYVQFSPADELHKVSEVMMRNAQAMLPNMQNA